MARSVGQKSSGEVTIAAAVLTPHCAGSSWRHWLTDNIWQANKIA
jgi:hypothetical protein